MDTEAHNQSLRLVFFHQSSAASWAGLHRSWIIYWQPDLFRPANIFSALLPSQTLSHVLLHHLDKFAFRTLDGEEAFHTKDPRPFWDAIIN